MRVESIPHSVCLVICIILPLLHAQGGQKLCETNSRLCKTGLCLIDECLTCNHENATCETLNPQELVPKKLLQSTISLDLTYTGPEVELMPDMFDFLPMLYTVTISGNITAVAPNTFVKQGGLKYLTIKNSKISVLPSDLFNSSHILESLQLPYSQFTEIPVNVFPHIPNVKRIDLSYNPLNSCDNGTIAPEFEKLQRLRNLKLVGYGYSTEICKNISRDYLSPLWRITNLDLSESLLFHGDQRILSSLTNLQRLTINGVAPYKYCPALAKELFEHIPGKLVELVLKNWASNEQFNESCIFDEDSLTGLKNLEKLSFLDMRYGDKLFGHVLVPSVFAGFNRMKTLYIDRCGIAFIETGAFNDIPLLADLGLRENLLGPRDLELYTKNQPSRLKNLNLNSVGIFTDKYYASGLLLAFPNLKSLYLNNNYFQTIPNFGANNNVSSVVINLSLNNNNIQRLSAEDGEKMCKVMPLLKNFKAERNELVDITGIISCPSIILLDLSYNELGKNQVANLKALGMLTRLQNLGLSYNKIKYVTPKLFQKLTSLKTLYLANNEITSLSNDLFMNTPGLESLDLSVNLLPVFNTSIVSNGLSKLESLYLQSNQITVLAPDLLSNLSKRLTKLKRFGIAGNPLKCSCDNYLSKWVRNSTVILGVRSLNCSTPDNEDPTTPVLDYEANFFQCNVKIPLTITAEILAAVVLSILLALPCYKYRWYISHPKVVVRAMAEKLREVRFEQKCEYDAFISYDTSSNKDSAWVVQKLIPAIEEETDGCVPNTPEMKLYAVDRDSAAGSPKYTERCRAIENSRKIIIILSNSYLANPDCLSEADLVAGYQFLDGHHCYQPNRILVLILDDLNEEAIKAPVTSLLTENVIHVGDKEARLSSIWRRVRRFISKPKYIYRKKQRKPETQDMVLMDEEGRNMLVR